MSTLVEYQVLWHRVTVEVAGDIECDAAPVQWPIEPAAQTRYRLSRTGDGWQLHHRSDLVLAAGDPTEAVRELDRRVLAQAFELAARRGWVPYRGALVRAAARRLCLVGAPGSVRAAAAELGKLESGDGWVVSRDGLALPVPARGRADVEVLQIAPIDEVLACDGGGAVSVAAPLALQGLLASADRTVLRAAAIVAATSEVVRRRGVPGDAVHPG